MDFPIIKHYLHKPNNKEVAEVIQKGLSSNFAEVSCEVLACPDLSKKPWELTMSGLCGSPSIGQIGGTANLMPLPKTHKTYDLRSIAKVLGYNDGHMIGAGDGPYPFVKQHSGMILNLRVGYPFTNKSRVIMVSDSKLDLITKTLPNEEARCSLTMSFFSCLGQTGPVLKINAKHRIGDKNFPVSIGEALEEHYGDKIVGLGGIFTMKSGRAKFHMLPDFSTTPLRTRSEVRAKFKLYELNGPLQFMSVITSPFPDPYLRAEHTHGYTSQEGGHYQFDVTPKDVEYEGYFTVAETMYQIDKP